MIEETLIAAMPRLTWTLAAAYLGPMEQAMAEFDIRSELRSRMWLAQVGHESADFLYFEEIADGSAYEGRKDLGNTQPGDGKKYKGRGPIQITGRYNYTEAGAALCLPLVDRPELAADPHGAAFGISAWWWATHGLNPLSDAQDVLGATRRINGGTNGLSDREKRYDRCKALGAAVVVGPASSSTPPAPKGDQPVALKRVAIPSPNYSSRSGTAVRLIVIHTAEGARTYQDLGAFFKNPASGVSSHTGIDDTPGTIGEYVQRSGKAWTQGNANGYSDAVELCAFAKWDAAEWDRHPTMLSNCAQWVAEEAKAFGIPLVRLTAKQATDGKSRGVCGHVDLGSAGGGHWDPAGFPMDRIIAMAAAGGSTPSTPSIPPGDDDMLIKEPNGQRYQLVYGGPSSYWRSLPDNAAKRIPAAWFIDDDGSLLALWKVGAGS